MHLLHLMLWSAVVVCALLCATGVGATYSEYLSGDMSDDPAAPTLLPFQPGSNLLVAETYGVDLAWFTVPAGHVLSSIKIAFHDHSYSRVFTGIQAGAVWTAGIGEEIDPAPMLGWLDFPINLDGDHSGIELLPDIGQAPGAIGFVPPLPSGAYTMLFQTSIEPIRHSLEFYFTPTGALAADFNSDGFVNGGDLAVWRQAFGTTAAADANNDGKSAGDDLLIWQREYDAAATAGSLAVVPEPAALALNLLGAWGMRRWLRPCRIRASANVERLKRRPRTTPLLPLAEGALS
ncbi:MAG: hypothetical protein KF847_18355 [Pirellulales bacterium]|nr:hypothetical protein [Pirellulales bacterium]